MGFAMVVRKRQDSEADGRDLHSLGPNLAKLRRRWARQGRRVRALAGQSGRPQILANPNAPTAASGPKWTSEAGPRLQRRSDLNVSYR